jgi:SulP family sulfate permease
LQKFSDPIGEAFLSRYLTRDSSYLKKSSSKNEIGNDSSLIRNISAKNLSTKYSGHKSGKPGAKQQVGSLKDSLDFLKNDWLNILREPYLGPNLIAGITVAAVALPLNIALAIASGLPPSSGLIAGAIGGGFAALFGGSSFQATGPAAALNIMVFAMVQQFGPMGAAAGAIIIGLIQVFLSLISAGSLIRFVPESVLIGFTSGVGIKLLDTQLPKLFGIDWSVYEMVRSFDHPVWLHEVEWTSFVSGLFVIFFILAFKSISKFPAALIGIAIATYVAVFLNWPIHRVGAIPPIGLDISFPTFNTSQWLELIQMAIPLGLLSTVESLLSAKAVDRLSGDKHHSNLEILGQAMGNIWSGLFGGMPVSGVVVRSSVSVQSGAKNRLSAFFHAMILLISALFLGKVLSHVPLAALAGLLCIIGFRLVEITEFFHLLQKNKIEGLAFLAAAAGTISNNIVTGMTVGLLLIWIKSRIDASNKGSAPSPKKTSEEIVPPLPMESLTDSPVYQFLDRGERWLQNLKAKTHIPSSAYIHPNSTIIGRVILGRNVHIAAEASIRADEGTPFYIGDNTNIQDGVVIHALKKKWVRFQNQQWAVYVGKNVSLAHQALVHGPSYIGDNTFVGFKAVVHDSIIGKGCYIGIGAVVVGVQIGDEKYIPHGAIIDTPEKARLLTKIDPSHSHFNDDVVEVNKGLVEAYKEFDLETSNSI